jgi:predicted PurR-regulated permease PerM
MRATVATTPQDAAITRLRPAANRSRAEWRLLRTRLSTITPQSLGRGILAAVVVVVCGWLAAATWPALLPFAVGGLLAYTIYPVVGFFDRFLPRVLAAAIALCLGLVVLGLIVALVIPPLVSVSIEFLRSVPDSTQLARVREQLDAYLATLPEGARALVTGVLERVAAVARDNLSTFLDSIAGLIVAGVMGIFDTIGFVVGLVLLPVWVLSVVRDGSALRGQIASQFAPGLRADAMALVTIVHRALSTFLRVQIAAAIGVGVAVYAGLELAQRAGVTSYQAELAIAAFMGTAQVIPQLGGLVGAVPILLVALVRPDVPEAWITLVVVYLVAQQLVKIAVGGRLGRDLNVRPALALPAFAVISQIGLVWLLFSAPILVIARNGVVYLRGRLADPPVPAGVLPWDRRRVRPAVAGASATGASGGAPSAPVPTVYRDRAPVRAAAAAAAAVPAAVSRAAASSPRPAEGSRPAQGGSVAQ